MRGIFLTMNSLFRECTFNSKPKVSRVNIQRIEHFIVFHSTGDGNIRNVHHTHLKHLKHIYLPMNLFHVADLFLICIPTRRISFQDAKFKLDIIVRNFEFCFRHLSLSILPPSQSVLIAAETDSDNSQHFRNFAIDDTCSIIKFLLTRTLPLHARFQDVLTQSHFIPLPKEAQLRVDDALSEMEAMDYREWNEEPLKSHREFYIRGSALFYRKYLLASHLSKSDLLDVEAFLRVQGIYTLIDNKPVNELAIWREVYPKSVCDGFIKTVTEPNSNRCVLSVSYFLYVLSAELQMKGKGQRCHFFFICVSTSMRMRNEWNIGNC